MSGHFQKEPVKRQNSRPAFQTDDLTVLTATFLLTLTISLVLNFSQISTNNSGKLITLLKVMHNKQLHRSECLHSVTKIGNLKLQIGEWSNVWSDNRWKPWMWLGLQPVQRRSNSWNSKCWVLWGLLPTRSLHPIVPERLSSSWKRDMHWKSNAMPIWDTWLY